MYTFYPFIVTKTRYIDRNWKCMLFAVDSTDYVYRPLRRLANYGSPRSPRLFYSRRNINEDGF